MQIFPMTLNDLEAI